MTPLGRGDTLSRAAAALATALLMLLTACSPTSEEPAAPEPSPSPSAKPSTPSAEPGPAKETPLSAEDQARLDERLRQAAWDNDVGEARRLIRRGADVNAKDSTQQNAYLIATSEGYRRLLELTLDHGARVNEKDSFNGTGIIRAAERGHWDIVGRLVRAGVPVDHVNNLGWTGLHEAIILGNGDQTYVDTVRVLVAAGADVELPSARDGVTPLQHARERGYDRIGSLLQQAIDVPARQGRNPAADDRLLSAATAGDADAVSLALRAGARLEARDEQRRTPLLLAVTEDHVEVARMLVALGADPDALDDQHDTPWLVTGVTGSVPMLETLLPARPDLTMRNRYGGVSVIPASERGHVAYVRRVVETGIDVNHVNDLGWTALLEAVILGDGSRPYQQIVRILLDAGADPAIADSDGVSALEHAESQGQQDVARILRRASRG